MRNDIKLLRPDATIALPYLRLSGVEADELSPDLQLRSILRQIRALDLHADARVEDDAILGDDVYADIEKGMHSAFKRDNMPAWLRLLDRARSDTRVAAVAAYDLSRAFRKIMAMLEETRLLNSFGVHLILNGQVVNLDDPHQWAQWVDQAKHAEFESRITTWRLREHYQEMRDLGINYSHTAPLGLQRTGKRHKVQWSTTDDFATIVTLCELYVAQDIGSPLLARALNQRGYTWVNRKGERVPVKPTTIRKTIATIEKYELFLPPDLYANVLRVRAARAGGKQNSQKTVHPPLLLRRVLFCARCGCRYTTMHQQVRDVRIKGKPRKLYQYDVYIHRGEHCEVSPRTLRAREVHAQLWERLAWLNDLSEAQTQAIVARMCESPTGDAVDARQLRDKITLQLRNLEEAYLAEDFGPLATARPQYRIRRAQLEKQLAELPEPKPVPALRQFVNAADARDWLEHLSETMRLGEALAPEEANRLMRDLFERIELDARQIVALQYHSDIQRWLQPPE